MACNLVHEREDERRQGLNLSGSERDGLIHAADRGRTILFIPGPSGWGTQRSQPGMACCRSTGVAERTSRALRSRRIVNQPLDKTFRFIESKRAPRKVACARRLAKKQPRLFARGDVG